MSCGRLPFDLNYDAVRGAVVGQGNEAVIHYAAIDLHFSPSSRGSVNHNLVDSGSMAIDDLETGPNLRQHRIHR